MRAGRNIIKVKLQPSRKIGFDIDDRLTEIIKSNFKKFYFFDKKQDLLNCEKSIKPIMNVVISMLNFIHILVKMILLTLFQNFIKTKSYVLLLIIFLLNRFNINIVIIITY